MYILNMTQHLPTTDQPNVVNFRHDEVKERLTFEGLPTREEVNSRAEALLSIARDWQSRQVKQISSATWSSGEVGFTEAEIWQVIHPTVMLGGHPSLMHPLHEALEKAGFCPVYAHSDRVSVETTNEAGEVVKTSKFKHLGFI